MRSAQYVQNWCRHRKNTGRNKRIKFFLSYPLSHRVPRRVPHRRGAKSTPPTISTAAAMATIPSALICNSPKKSTCSTSCMRRLSIENMRAKGVNYLHLASARRLIRSESDNSPAKGLLSRARTRVCRVCVSDTCQFWLGKTPWRCMQFVGWVERSEIHRGCERTRWGSLRSTHPTS